jgi:uncharacterized protein YggE
LDELHLFDLRKFSPTTELHICQFVAASAIQAVISYKLFVIEFVYFRSSGVRIYRRLDFNFRRAHQADNLSSRRSDMNFGSMRLYRGVSVLAIAVGFAHAASAQSSISVRGQGTATLVRPADHLHLEVQVNARGKDVPEAMSKLKDLETEVQKKLAAIQDGKFVFDASRLDADDDPQKNYMRMMQAMANPNARKKPAAPQGVSAVTTLRCDWELKGSNADEVSLAAYQLQEKVKASNAWKPAGAANDLKAQEEAEENDQSNMQMQMNYPGAAAKPGQPVFTFIATFPQEEISKGTAQAFESAKQQASDLAKAAGKSLGELTELDGSRNNVGMSPDNPMAQYIAMMQAASEQKPAAGREPNVIVGDQPGAVSMQVAVTARFQLK